MHDVKRWRQTFEEGIAQDKMDDANASALQAGQNSFGSTAELAGRFGLGTHGHHELYDRAMMFQETWEHYIVDHPANAFIPGAAGLAKIISDLMCDFYQLTATAEDYAKRA